MNIDELKSKAEDVEPVEPEITPEQKEQTEKFLRSAVIRKFRLALNLLYKLMLKKKYTIAEVKQHILDKDKTMPFSASQRQFIMGFKDEFLVTLLKDIYNSKDLNEINLTVSESVSSESGNSGNLSSNS